MKTVRFQQKRRKVRSTPKGRVVDPQAREEVRALLADAPRRRDLLIEYLHRIQDRYHCLSAVHLVALASEMKLAMTEVYEVATFYHHFDVVKEGDLQPPPITVRVCDSLSCEMAGAHELLQSLPGVLGPYVRVLHAPCVGRCETAPVAVVGQNPVPHATPEKVQALVGAGAVAHPASDGDEAHPHLDVVSPGHLDYAAYRKSGGYALAGHATHIWHYYLAIGVMGGTGVAAMGMVPAAALLSRWFTERLGLVIGDIAGKGMPAALLMANLQANLRSQCAIAVEEPERLLRSVNTSPSAAAKIQPATLEPVIENSIAWLMVSKDSANAAPTEAMTAG